MVLKMVIHIVKHIQILELGTAGTQIEVMVNVFGIPLYTDV